jgi:hypothetical protein
MRPTSPLCQGDGTPLAYDEGDGEIAGGLLLFGVRARVVAVARALPGVRRVEYVRGSAGGSEGQGVAARSGATWCGSRAARGRVERARRTDSERDRRVRRAARWRHRSGEPRATRRATRGGEVDVAAAGRGEPRRFRRTRRIRVRRRVGGANEVARGSARRERGPVVVRGDRFARDSRCTREYTTARARRRFDSDDGAARGRIVRGQRVASARLRDRAHGIRKAHRLRDVRRRPRHEGRLDRGPATARASRRYGAVLRRRERRGVSDRARA